MKVLDKFTKLFVLLCTALMLPEEVHVNEQSSRSLLFKGHRESRIVSPGDLLKMQTGRPYLKYMESLPCTTARQIFF